MINEQTILLFFLILGLVVTFCLYIWKAKKEISYKKDERWQLIQNKANNTTNYLNYLLIVLVAVLQGFSLFSDTQITFTLNRILTYAILFLALRNATELVALRYFDNRM